MPKPCDACHASSAAIYCRADAAFLCVGCDGKVHGANKLASRHERVWMCEVCELAPAVVTCKADVAALCVSCDTDIHSANPLARRHERVPVTPFFECPSVVKGARVNNSVAAAPGTECGDLLKEDDETTAAEAASWLLPHPKPLGDELIKESATDGSLPPSPYLEQEYSSKVQNDTVKAKAKAQLRNANLFADVDPYLDLDYASAMGASQGPADSLVPVHSPETPDQQSPPPSRASSYETELSGKNGYNYGRPSLKPQRKPLLSYCCWKLSSSSLDVGVVPDGSSSDIVTPFQGALEYPPPVLHVGHMEPMAREARVMRYKEKRKPANFEKTVRYASRKAYAESRPRIKGRFAKRTDPEVEQMFSVDPEASFSVVPSLL